MYRVLSNHQNNSSHPTITISMEIWTNYETHIFKTLTLESKVTIFTLEKKNISDWPKSGPVETGPTGPVATPLCSRILSLFFSKHSLDSRLDFTGDC